MSLSLVRYLVCQAGSSINCHPSCFLRVFYLLLDGTKYVFLLSSFLPPPHAHTHSSLPQQLRATNLSLPQAPAPTRKYNTHHSTAPAHVPWQASPRASMCSSTNTRLAAALQSLNEDCFGCDRFTQGASVLPATRIMWLRPDYEPTKIHCVLGELRYRCRCSGSEIL